MLMTRDSQQSFAIGQPEFVGAHTEEELVSAFSHEAVVGNDGRVLRQENADLYPFDYGRILQRNTGEELRRRYGGVVPAGSRQEAASEWGGHDPGTGSAAASPAPAAGGIAGAADGEQSAQPQGTPPANGGEIAIGEAAAPHDGPVAEGGEATAQASAPAAGGGISRRAAAPPSSDIDDEIPF